MEGGREWKGGGNGNFAWESFNHSLLFDGEEMKLLTAKDLYLLRGVFLMGEMSKFLAVGWDFLPCPGFPIKVQGKGEQSTPGGCNYFVTFLVRREMPGI